MEEDKTAQNTDRQKTLKGVGGMIKLESDTAKTRLHTVSRIVSRNTVGFLRQCHGHLVQHYNAQQR